MRQSMVSSRSVTCPSQKENCAPPGCWLPKGTWLSWSSAMQRMLLLMGCRVERRMRPTERLLGSFLRVAPPNHQGDGPPRHPSP